MHYDKGDLRNSSHPGQTVLTSVIQQLIKPGAGFYQGYALLCHTVSGQGTRTRAKHKHGSMQGPEPILAEFACNP